MNPIQISSGASHITKMGEMPGILEQGGGGHLKVLKVIPSLSIVPAEQRVCRGPGAFSGIYILQGCVRSQHCHHVTVLMASNPDAATDLASILVPECFRESRATHRAQSKSEQKAAFVRLK